MSFIVKLYGQGQKVNKIYVCLCVRHHKSSGYASRFALPVHTLPFPSIYLLPLSSSPSSESLL